MSNEPEEIDDDLPEHEEGFVECDKCDGHDACADFGCAFDLGLGHMLKKEPFEW